MCFNFNSILAVDNFFNCLKSCLILAAFLKLRLDKPDLKRSYKVPIHSRNGLLLFLFVPAVTGLCVVGLSFAYEFPDSYVSLGFNVGGLLFGAFFYISMKKMGYINYQMQPGDISPSPSASPLSSPKVLSKEAEYTLSSPLLGTDYSLS